MPSRLTLLWLVAVPLSATAQAPCSAGQVTNDDTQGHCCWPAQAWSVTRSVCVGTPTCPEGFTATQTACVAATVQPPMVAPGDAPRLSTEARLLKHMQLAQELTELQRSADEKHWIADFVIGGAVGGGLLGLGYALNVVLLGALPSSAAGYASFWSFFGCVLGGGITFAVLVTVATVKLVQWVILKRQIDEKTAELAHFDEVEHLPAQQASVSLWQGPSPAVCVLEF